MIELHDSTLRCTDFASRDLAKQCGFSYNRRDKTWEAPLRGDVARKVLRIFHTSAIEHDARAPLAEALEAAVREDELRGYLTAARTNDDVLEALSPAFDFVTEPYRHQRHAWLHGIYLQRICYFLEMGLGKTKVTIDDWCWHRQQGESKRCLIVAPASLLWNWFYEFQRHSNIEPVVLTGSSATKLDKALAGDPVCIVNYEALRGRGDEYAELGFDFVTFDESTRLKNPKTKQSKAAKIISAAATNVRLLTGTPITKSLQDIFGQFLVLDGGVTFGTSQYRFHTEHFVDVTPEGTQFAIWRPKKTAVPAVKNSMYRNAVRYTKDQCLDLPERTYTDWVLDMPPAQAALYKAVAQEIRVSIDGATALQAQDRIVQILRLAQASSGFQPTEEGIKRVASAKLAAIGDLLEVSEGHKLIIWCRFREEVAMICERLVKSKVPYVEFHGGVDQALRPGLVIRFQTDPACRVFVATAAAGSFGLTLTAADIAVFYSVGYDYEIYKQALDRNHRIGQDKPVEYIHLICKGTIDSRIMKILENKGNLADLVTGDLR